jgi:hypothetical protein
MPYSIWYDWQDDGNDNNDKEHRFGLLRHGTLWHGAWESRSTKPSFIAVRKLAGLLKGYRFDALLENDSVIVVRYVKNSQAAYAAWSADNVHHNAEIDLPSGKWLGTHLQGSLHNITAVSGQKTLVDVDKTPIIIQPSPAP